MSKMKLTIMAKAEIPAMSEPIKRLVNHFRKFPDHFRKFPNLIFEKLKRGAVPLFIMILKSIVMKKNFRIFPERMELIRNTECVIYPVLWFG